MTTEVAKPEDEGVGPGRAGQAKRRAGGASRLLRMLEPGVVIGASDDDPSGIGTYSQVGAQFGYGLLWTMLISYPILTVPVRRFGFAATSENDFEVFPKRPA
jgi:hypothetical protein